MRTIIFIIETPYWQRDHHRFGGEYLMEKGYHVEIWRIMRENSIEYETPSGMYQGDNLYRYTFKEFLKQIRHDKDSVYMLQRSGEEISLALAKAGCNYVIMNGLGRLPSPEAVKPGECGNKTPEKDSFSGFFRRSLERGIPATMRILKKRIQRKNMMPSYLRAIENNPPMMLVTSTHDAAKEVFISEELEKSKQVLYIHSRDYDRFIEANRECPQFLEKHILYCDGGAFAETYDEVANGKYQETRTYKREFFRQLHTLFDLLSDFYHLPVIVSGHPHTKYEKDDFGGSEIVYNKTCELARDAALVMTTGSLAINFGVMYNKQMMNISNDYFRKPLIADDVTSYDYVEYWSKSVLGIGFLNMSDQEELMHPWQYVKKMDPQTRDNYMRGYIIDGSVTEQTAIECIEQYF